MNKSKKDKKQIKPLKKNAKRFKEAKESLLDMQKEISPFIKKRVFDSYSTSGKWCKTSSLCS